MEKSTEKKCLNCDRPASYNSSTCYSNVQDPKTKKCDECCNMFILKDNKYVYHNGGYWCSLVCFKDALSTYNDLPL